MRHSRCYFCSRNNSPFSRRKVKLTLQALFDYERCARLSFRAMALLLETEPPPSPAPGAAKETSGATPRHAKDHGALAPGRDRFIGCENAEEEDVKEDVLLYAFLAQSPSHQEALSQARAAISGFLKERCEVSVGYDAEDALRRLLADGLVTSDPDGNLTAIAPAEARDHLDTLWDRLLDVDSLDRAASPGEA
jgi:hypothetical protein